MKRGGNMTVRLHLGCGSRDFGPTWDHIDGGDYPHLKSKDILKLPYEDNSVDLIYASHVLEYFDREEVKTVLAEWFRVLREGGTLRVAVPDFTRLSCLYCDGDIHLDQVLGPLFGRMKMGDVTIYHKTVYDRPSLANVLHEAGFHFIRDYNWRNTEHSHFDDHSQSFIPHMDKDNGTLISLNMEATK